MSKALYSIEIDSDENTVTATLTENGVEVARFDGFQDGEFFEGDITTPFIHGGAPGKWFRGTDIESALREVAA